MLQRIRAFFAPQNLTEGNILQGVLRFSVPLILGNLAQQLYSTVDSIIVGQVVTGGLAAIGSTFPVINFSILFFAAIATGAGVMVSQFFGSGERERLTKTVGNTLMLILFSTLILIAILIPLANPFLRLINTPGEILNMSTSYLRITFLGFLGAAFFNIGSGILRGLGDSFSPLIYLVISTIMNTVLDILFVWHFNWGVAGAAWATIASQAVSAILVLRKLLSSHLLNRLEKSDYKLDFKLIKELIRLGIPSGISQGLFSIAMIFLQNLVHLMGTSVTEANTIVIRLDGFAMLPNMTFGIAATTFTAQNIGARKLDRVREGAKTISRLSFFVSLSVSLLLIIFGKQMFSLFTREQDIIQLAYQMMLILSFGYVAFSQLATFSGVMRGAGDTMTPMWIALGTTILFRVPLAYFLAWLTRSPEWPHGSPYILSASLLIGWTTACILHYIFYRRGKWKNKAIV